MKEINKVLVRTYSMLGAARTFGQALIDLAQDNDAIVAVTADQRSAGRLEYFEQKYPGRLFNVGIAEQNLINVAAGMANEGLIPYTLAQACFSTARCFDQFKISLGYMNLNVKVVGFGAGLSLGQYSATHMSVEDISLVRNLPNVTILSPADCLEAYKAVVAAVDIKGPVYIRLTGEMGNPIVYDSDYNYQIGKAITLKEGSDISIIATGSMVYNSLKAAEMLEEKGLSVKVIDMHTIKPIDKDAVNNCFSSKLIVTVEEHSKIGGLGSAVQELFAMSTTKPAHLILGCDNYYPVPGEYKYLVDLFGLSPEKITTQIATCYDEL